MKPFLLVCLVFVAVCLPLSAHAQTRSKSQEYVFEPQVNPKNWKEFSSSEGRFSIVAPGALEQEDQEVLTTRGTPVTLHFFRMSANAEYTVVYLDEASPVEGTGQEKMVLETFRDLAVQAVKGRLVSDIEIKFDGHPAHLQTVEYGTENKYLLIAKTIIVGRRVYMISTSYLRDLSPEATRMHDEWAARFRESFKLHTEIKP